MTLEHTGVDRQPNGSWAKVKHGTKVIAIPHGSREHIRVMSLLMGRGQTRVRSCGLVIKRDGAARAVKMRGAEREINARVSDVLLQRDRRRELYRHGK
jgi:hypothetical protein